MGFEGALDLKFTESEVQYAGINATGDVEFQAKIHDRGAFQLADGFTNLIVPTSGALIGTLGVARLDWAVWARFQIRFQALLLLVASIAVVVAVFIGYQ